MKIKETVERECCSEPKDMRRYNGLLSGGDGRRNEFNFCVHCGQIWRDTTRMDAAGGTEYTREKVVI